MRSLLVAPLVAVGFLTVLPTGRRLETPAAAFPRAIAFFPVVGAAVGLIVGSFDLAAGAVLPSAVVSALDLALLAVLSGGLHLDGLGDAADGLLTPGRSAEVRLALMRSGTSGPFGAAAIALVLLIELTALAALPAPRAPALVVAATLSRWAMAAALWTWPYARRTGLGRAFTEGLRGPDVGAATLAALVVAVIAAGTAAALPMLATLAVSLGVGTLALRRVGGVTGDVCGAIGELSFAASLIALSGARA